jgi:hypothetical protein
MKNYCRYIKSLLFYLLTNWVWWLVAGICVFALTFIIWLLPICIHLNLQIFYSNTAWLTTSYPATIIITTLFCAITSEFVVNKQENVFWMTKDVSRTTWFMSKYITSCIINFCYILIFFIFYVLLDTYIRNTDAQDKAYFFNIDVKCWGILITLIIFGLFGTNACLLTNFVHWQFTSSIILTILTCGFVLLFPMIWYVDNPLNDHPDPHRWWYLLYGPLSLYMSLNAVLFGSFFTWLQFRRLSL